MIDSNKTGLNIVFNGTTLATANLEPFKTYNISMSIVDPKEGKIEIKVEQVDYEPYDLHYDAHLDFGEDEYCDCHWCDYGEDD